MLARLPIFALMLGAMTVPCLRMFAAVITVAFPPPTVLFVIRLASARAAHGKDYEISAFAMGARPKTQRP